ncbi:DUF4260 domain-containing protein [Cytobacillus kochii]|uniref:DUF4260 domain-containing protein n=1 Tax=Cytobacillus kochii TaxID=859143 RepID=UPI002480826D|nr:DUF4260 domain-containing protein [Cytobacillus kochii]
MSNRIIVKWEYILLLLLTVVAYITWEFSILAFVIFLFLPDVFMFGYLLNNKVGTILYNIGHTFIFPLLILGIYFVIKEPILLMVSLIWSAHISMDRALGYGLKYEEGFKVTHLQKI